MEARVSGRFSADGGSISAEEVFSYVLGSGDQVDFHSRWAAARDH
jgi:hypothetical protein